MEDFSNKNNQLVVRNTHVDVMKAILIITMVIGHSTSPWVTYIYLFHMPAFLVLSGYTYHGEKYTVGKYIRKKLFTIFLPALIINLFFCVFYSIVQRVGIYGIFSSEKMISLWERVLKLLKNWSTPDFGGATWFLIVLFEVECGVKIIDSFLRKFPCLFLVCIFGLGIGGYILTTLDLILPYCLDLAMLGCLYYGFGILIRRKNLLQNLDQKVMLPFSIISTIIYGNFYFYGKLPMNWPTRDFSNLFIQLWSCLGAMYIVWYISGIVNCSVFSSIFQWLGRHTYCVLTMHFVIFRCLFGIGVLIGRVSIEQMQHLTPDAQTAQNGGWMIIGFLTIVLCGVIAKVSEKNRWTNYFFNARIPGR